MSAAVAVKDVLVVQAGGPTPSSDRAKQAIIHALGIVTIFISTYIGLHCPFNVAEGAHLDVYLIICL
jgi:hypothetical protein